MLPHVAFSFPNDLIDILVVAFVIYRILLSIKGTRAFHILLGLILLVVAYAGSQLLELAALGWLLNVFLSSFILVVVILFQNDIRRALAEMGKHPSLWGFGRNDAHADLIEELSRAASALAARKTGALIAVERETRLRDHTHAGVQINGRVSRELLEAIFQPTSPLHDGAVLVGDGQVVWAASFLPLSTRHDLDKTFGTRHRAAIGLTEETDAVVIVVSEESGSVSLAVNGRITRDLDQGTLHRVLTRLLVTQPKAKKKRPKLRKPSGKEATA